MNDSILTKPSIDDDSVISSRRRFLKHIACGSLLAMGTGSGLASAAVRHVVRQPSHKVLALQNPNTGDALKLAYFENGRYIKGALREFNYLLRDFHNDTVHPIDPALLDQLYDLKQTLGISKPFHIISGYRSPYTNANLRRHSHGVAKHSLHMEGRAIDIRVEGLSSGTIRKAAVFMARGGVGYYPRSNFVHLDTGDFRVW